MTHSLPPDEILPCPFDGENASTHQDEKEWWKVACEKCGARILSIYPTEDSAIEAWNTRAHLSAPPAGDDLVEKLEQTYRECADEYDPEPTAYREGRMHGIAIALEITRQHHASQAEIIRELREALVSLRHACKLEPAMNHHKYDLLGEQVNKALAASERYAPDTGDVKATE